MGLTKSVLLLLLLVLATFSLCRAFTTFVPNGNEVVYQYRALIKAGTHDPVSFASQTILNGKVHVYVQGNVSSVWLTDLTYQMYNGRLDHIHEHQINTIPVPNSVANELQKPWTIIYDTNGVVTGISMEVEEKEYVKNIKRAITSILQIEHPQIIEHGKVPHGFVSKEHSIYGEHKVVYNVVPYDDEVHVHKMTEMDPSIHKYQHIVSNVPQMVCGVRNNDVIYHDSQKKYIIVQKDGHQVVSHIESNGGIFYHPYDGKSIAHYLLVNQTFDMVNIVPSHHETITVVHQVDNKLTYQLFDENLITEAVFDVSQGRRVVDYKKVVPVVIRMLEETVQYLPRNHIHMEVPNVEHGQLINRLLRVLSLCDHGHLDQIHTNLKQKTTQQDVNILTVYYQIVSLVGTRASVHFIRDLIVQNTLPVDVVVDLLQNYPTYIKSPTLQLVSEVETLIHLPETIPWTVRKHAILSFGVIINKALHSDGQKVPNNMNQQQQHHCHQPLHQDPQNSLSNSFPQYEKYIVQFMDIIKSSNDPTVQSIYLNAIINMKIPIVSKHLEPLIKGDFGHRSLRVSSIFALSSSGTNSDVIFQLLWPILTNRNEHTEVRLFSYITLMKTNQSPSRLSNMFWALMNEPNHEVYNFHYTFMKSLMETADPCKEVLKQRVVQLMRFMNPPSHGVSSITMIEYKDPVYGFSKSMYNVFCNTKDTTIVASFTSSRVFNHYMEHNGYIVTAYGINNYLNEMYKLKSENIVKFLQQMHAQKDFTIEVMQMKNGICIDSWFINQHHLQDIQHIIDIFTKDQLSINKNHIHITYERYRQIYMTTDLGTPAVWEFIMPVVEKESINIKKEIINKVINVHIDNNYVQWSHLRHGLSFYNPIADVWQGVNQYHSFDSVIPVYVDVSLNPQQQSVKLSWKRHNDVQKDIAGYRSHSTQMVFVKDDFQYNILQQSCHACQEFTVVQHGKDYRHNYRIMDKHDLNTGLHYQMIFYDSERHISNGTYQHLVNVFTQSQLKSYQNPLSHLMATYMHANDYVHLLPSPHNLGVMVKYVPSTEYSVSNVDVTIRLNQEIYQEDHAYTPASKTSVRLTYAVKNKEKSLKTWDINAIVDLNAGHTMNNLKVHLTRIVPGQKDYKICVDGVKKWTHKGYTGHLNIAMSQSADGKCVKDDTVIDVTMTGQQSHEQIHEKHVYGECNYMVPYFITPYHTLSCLADHTSIRHYVYNIKTTNVPTYFKNMIHYYCDMIKGVYSPYYTYEEEHHENIGDHNVKVEITYPMQGHEVDVNVITQQHLYKLTRVPTKDLHVGNIGFVPDSTVYSKLFMFFHSVGLVDHCVIQHDRTQFNQQPVNYVGINDVYNVYIGDAVKNPKQAVYVKKIDENQIAVKVVDKGHVLEVVPQVGDHYQCIVDGKMVNEQVYHDDWVTVHQMPMVHLGTQPVVIMIHHFGVHLEYNGHNIVAVMPKTHPTLQGRCFSHNV